ncbi:MAG: HAMP domain-containing histidine kinase [Gemmatimonadota bacterium]|nr:MAG: HAMP domain-containing histidine kinase [Gemmatimonadota bacterium]
MSFRVRLLFAFLFLIFVAMIVFAFAVRREVASRLTAQYERRVNSLVTVIEEDLEGEGEVIATTLAGLSDALANDNRFRRAALDLAAADRRYLLDYAGIVMRLTGLSMLQIQDETGRIISSGHFRNEYDRLEPELPQLLATVPGGLALARARTPEGPFIALVRADSVRMGRQRFTIVGGKAVGRGFLVRLERDEELHVTLTYPDGVLSSTGLVGTIPAADTESGTPVEPPATPEDSIASELNIPFADAERNELAEARLVVTHPLSELRALRRRIDLWFLTALGATAAVAFVLANWLAGRISRPLAELARKTSRIDLDRLDIDFGSRRNDEIGALSRLLGAMTERLRTGAARLREAERRATLGELARQVNHDIKNGLIPIRNVFRHLAQVARDEPGDLSAIFDERRRTLDSGIAYLENLASNYARLYPRLEPQACDVNAVIRQVVGGVGGIEGVELELDLAERLPAVHSDVVVLRRILENLVDNALDSLDAGAGTVSVATRLVGSEDERPRVRIVVADTGRGMSEQQRAKIFDDFYTTKEEGTGLGLSIVRRLLRDLDGTLQVESEEGKGSRFTVELPASDAVMAAPEGGSAR